jgi:alkylation response protein AidB-like acyl-CoA dehydrogenase
MDFTLSKEQMDIQKAARDFARGEFDPDLVLECDRKREFPETVWKKACDLGFMGVHYPEEVGGQGLGLVENALIVESFCRQDSGFGAALALSDFGAEVLVRHGTEEQKGRVLPPLVQGLALMALAHMEEGCDPKPFTTTAVKESGRFVIQGMKCLVPFGDLSGAMIVLCRTGPEVQDGLTAVLVERGMQGVEVKGRGEVLGMRMVPLCDVSFRKAVIPEEGAVGREGEGRAYLAEFLNAARIECGAMGVGIAQGSLDRAVEYARRREQFGRPIAAFDAVRNRLADMIALAETARLVVYSAAQSLDRGKPDQKLILLSKMVGCRAALRVADDALQIHGGYGYMTEGHIEHFYRDAKALDLFLEPGTRQRSLLADHIVGKGSA